jgi:murein DD-endopeptidase MepM/ murein hydrolase activator NlpD
MTDHSAPQPSFDPRSWKRTAGAAALAAPPPPGRARPAVPAAALAGSAAILLLGAIAAYWSRQDEMAATAAGAVPASDAARPETIRNERRMLVLSGAQDLEAALVASGVDAASARQAAALATPALKPGDEIRAAMTLAPREGGADLVRLEASNADSSGVIVQRSGQGFAATPVVADLTARVVVRRGTMDDDSFYSSAVTAGVTDSLIPDFAAALAFDFDFQREVKKGDAFEAAFEQRVDREGRPVGPPRLLYAALSTRAKAAAVYRFTPPGAEAGWFDGDGRSIKRALLRTPVDAARVSSGFGFRIHPILGFAKLHRGTDFAAPTGTPIYASGDGVVRWAAMKGANGNLTVLSHDNGWQTYYLHQSAFMPGIAPGVRVTQGQEIGKVGTTGRSTGPHLHYELHVDGQPVDPLSIQTEAAPPLTGGALAGFKRERDRIDVSRARSTAS